VAKWLIFGGLVGTLLLPSVSFASPQVQVLPGEIKADFSYTLSRSTEKYHEDWGSTSRSVDGHAQEYNITYGLKDDYAVSLGLNNYRYNTFDDGQNQQTTPSNDTIDINVQKRITNNLALFAGIKHVTGSWTYASSAYIPPAITRDNSSQNIAEIGFIGEVKLSNRTRAFATAGAGHDLREYKVGLSYDRFDIGYRYVKYDNLYNPLFATTGPSINGLDLTVKGLYFGMSYKL